MSSLSLSRLASLINLVNLLSCICQVAPKIDIVLGSVAFSDDEGDTTKAPQALASSPTSAMDELAHEQVEIRAKSAQEQAPLEKTPMPKPWMIRANKIGDTA